MAVLHNSSELSLDLWEAADRQRNGKPYVIGSSVSVPVTKRFYDKVFEQLENNEALKKALSKITYGRMENAWKELYGLDFSGIHIPTKGIIQTVPYIKNIPPEYVLVALPFYIIGATEQQIEGVIRKCMGEQSFQCVGKDVHVKIEHRLLGTFDLST
jgi:hypothetical protein